MSTFCNVFEELCLQGNLCDSVIRIRDVEFKVHKIILCSCSSYFRDLFCSKPEQQVYSFPDVSPNVMQLILEYAYTHSVAVTEDNVLDLLEGAERFAVHGIIQSCCTHLLQKLCSKNCINIWKLADRYKNTYLRDKVYLYILHHFEEVAGHSAEFLLLSAEQLADLIEKDEVNVMQESTVFEAVLRWINFAPKERRGHMTKMMSKVRLLLMTVDDLLDTVTKDDLVKNNLQCLSMLTNSTKTLQDSNMDRSLVQTRLPSQVLLAIGGHKIEVYNVQSGCWGTVYRSEKAFPKSGSCVYLNGNIYCIGGNSNFYSSSVQKFSLATQTWQDVVSMHKARCFVSVVVLNGLIYIMGGCNEFETLNSAERFKPETNQWTMIAPMYKPRADAGSATLHGNMYVYGGFWMDEPLSSAECYNPNTNQWTMITPMSSPRTSVEVLTYQDQIYVAGGYNGVSHVSSVTVYDPKSKTGRAENPKMCSCSNFRGAVLEDQLYVAGDLHNNRIHFGCKVKHCDGKTDTWQLVQGLEQSCGDMSCCVVE